MKKITKYGLSALCGSLAAVSAAHAGELSVAGAGTMTYTSVSNAVTGNPFGMSTNITFTGSGELDGGQTFAVSMANDDKSVYSTASISLTTNSLGTFKMNHGGGGAGIGGYDDKSPTAWEESWGSGLSAGLDLPKGVSNSTNINWTSPKIAATSLQVAYAPRNDGAQNNDKATSGAISHKGYGYDVVLDMNPQFDVGGFNLYAGYSFTDLGGGSEQAQGKARQDDHEEGVAGLIINVGPVTAGIQYMGEHLASQVEGNVNYYGNNSWGVAFNVNDNLSVSYGETWSKKGMVDPSDNENPDKTEIEAINIAYTMGAASLKFAHAEMINGKYNTANDFDATTIALSLAF